MPVRCVIFDCDGTLVDSEPLASEVMVEMVGEHGLALDLESSLRMFAGRKLDEGLAELESREGCRFPESFVPEFRARSAQRLADAVQAMPHVDETLERLDLPRCVASSAPRAKTELNLSVTGLDRHFETVFSAYEINSWKPEPDLFLVAASHLGFAPRDCVVVEDSDHGIAAGLAAGMQVITYRRSDVHGEGLSNIDSYWEFLPLLADLD
ncbi:MAG: HAD family hydrolase [Gammaproteobacteria bacterium]|nr:HAD family hydrolase [Gammaproteobacteria bacterium]